MASNKVQIQVELKGAQQVNKQLDSIEKNSVDLSEGFKGVGESFKSVGDVVKAQGGMMGDAFGVLGESVGAITDSVGSFKDSMELAGQTGGKAWLAMLGPIAAVVSGVSLAIEAYREFSGANREAEDAAENMAAAASDTASRLEAMVEAGVNLGTEALKEFISVNEKARLAIEQTIKTNEKRTLSDQKLVAAQKALLDAENSIFFTESRVAVARFNLEKATTEYTDALNKQVEASIKANAENKKAFELQELLMKPYEELVGAVRQEREAFDDLQTRLLNTTNIRGKEKLAIENTLKRKKELIAEETKYKDLMKVIDDQLKKGIVSQNDFDKTNRAMRENLSNTQKELKKVNEELKPYVESLEASKQAQDGLKSLGKEAFSKRNAENIQDLNRELTLLDRHLQDQKDTLTNYGFEFNEIIKKNINAIGKQADAVVRQKALADTMRQQQKDYFKEKGLEPDQYQVALLEKQQELSKQLLSDYVQMEKKANEDLTEKLLEIEERRVEVLLFLRLKEINEMEISEKRKKRLRDEALADALYTDKRLAEVTKNSLKDQLNQTLFILTEKADAQRKSGLEEHKINTAIEKEKKQSRINSFMAEMTWRKDLNLLTAESNKELLQKQIDLSKSIGKREEQERQTELYSLRQYSNSKEEILKNHNARLTEEQKQQIGEEVKALNLQIEQKIKMNKNANEMFANQKIADAAKLRDLDLELYIQQKRNIKGLSNFWLSNDQIRANSTFEFYKNEREKQKQYFADEMTKFEEQINDRSVKIKQYQNLLSEATGKEHTGKEEIVKAIELESKKIEAIEKLKQESLERQANSNREYNDRMAQYDLEHYQAVGSLIKDFSDSSAQAFINAGVAAAFAGESISDAIRTTLRGLAQEATARALYEGAAALGSLAIGDAKGAALHGNSAAAFGIAAAAMGALTAAVGVPGGGSSGGGGTTSPTGLSQTSEAPQRESAKTEAMVFNINFGNAVIYDTRAAAERAMAERVMELGVRARRGYNPPRPRI